jgi:hypothetical protein
MNKVESLSPKQERNRKFVAESIIEKFYLIQRSDETKRRTLGIKNHLARNPKLNYIIIFSHTFPGDPGLAGRVATEIDPENTRPVVAPVAAAHTVDRKQCLTFKERKENLFLSILNGIARNTGVKTFPIVQTIDKNSSKEEALEGYSKFFKELKKLSGEGVGCIVSPEGHRSEDGKLQKGEEGIRLMAKTLRPTIVIPVGIYFEAEEKEGILTREYKRSGLNFGKKINVNIGDYRILEEGQKMTSGEMMDLLADTLPRDLLSEEYLSDEQKIELARMPEVRTIVK